MKKEHKIALKTMAMKAKLVNFLRTELYDYSGNDYQIKYKGKKPLTDKIKLETFDKMYGMFIDMNNELSLYKTKRKYKAEVERLRAEKNSEKVGVLV
jgi:hypothetical protein